MSEKNEEFKIIKFDSNYDYMKNGGGNDNYVYDEEENEQNDNTEDDNEVDEQNDNEAEEQNDNEVEEQNDNEVEEQNDNEVQEQNDNEAEEQDEDKIIEREAPNNESEVKSIVFSNNIGNIIFNNVENTNINKFFENNKNVIIEEEVALKDSEIIYRDDTIYLKELINQFLSEYKVTSQESKYIQKIVEQKALDVIDIKNIGIVENDMFEKGIEYKLVYDMFYDHFKSNIVIPIVSDKHKIYVNLKNNHKTDNNNDNINTSNLNIYFSESLEDKNGIVEENQFNQFILLKELNKNKSLDKIEYQSYINDFFEISKPYILNMEKLGYLKKSKDDILVLRYNDIDTIHWNTYVNEHGFTNKKDIFDEKGKIIKQEDNVLLKTNEINIIGFMVLSSNSLNKEFQKVCDITKIYNTDDGIMIECPNHNIKKDEIIFIDNTNCFPPINNIFGKSVQIIDKNKIKLNVDLELLKESTQGTLYKLPKLDYEQYNIIKKDDKLKAILKNKDDDNNNNYNDSNNSSNNISKNSLSKNKAYLFNDIHIDKTDYENIIKMIMPSLNDIVEYYKDDLNNAYTYDDVNNIFQKYNLKIDNFNIHQISIIKQILNNNLNKLLKYYEKIDEKNIILNLNKNSKKQFDTNYFLSNKYITDKGVEALYGKYKYIGKPEDNTLLRLRWVESMIDYGQYYYLNYSSKQNLDYDIKYISEKKKNISKLLNDLEKIFNKEVINSKNKSERMYKYQAYKIKPEDGTEVDGFTKLKNKLENDTYVFYNDKLYIWKGKLVDIDDIENNSLALVGGNELWVYKKDKWEKSIIVPKYDNIAYLCSLNNTELSKLKIDSLDCVYRKGSGCNSKLYYRLLDNINKMKTNLEKMIELENYLKNEKEIIENKMEDIKNKYFLSIEQENNTNYSNNSNNNKSNNSNSDIKNNQINNDKNNKLNDKISKKQNKSNINDPLSLLLYLIKNVQNDSLRLHYIYSLIHLDGIVINNNIYSKRYNKDMNICGHYYYLKQIAYANSPEEKEILINKMYNKYSDDGYSEKKLHTCKNCGENIGIIDYDETEGFSDSGALKKVEKYGQKKKSKYK